MFMKIAATDNQKNGATDAPWPSVLEIASSDEFQQSFAVAQLAVKLCEKKRAELKTDLQKESIIPEKFLKEAWELIQSARELVSRPQTHKEYLVAHGGSHESAENVVGSILSASRVSFEKLCDAERNKADTEIIKLSDVETGKTIKVEWRVYRGKGGERAFDNLFWDYWCANSILAWHWWAVRMYGEKLLASWKCDGVPPNDFLALARFRRERNNKRAANLKKKPKPKPKRRRIMAKARA
jgi:hypothetical protein